MAKSALNRAQRRQLERSQRQKGSRADLSLVAQSQPPAQVAWPSPAHREDKLALLEKFDGMAGLRNGLNRVAGKLEEWAGIPMPLEGEQLVVEPTYNKAAELMAMCGKPKPEESGDAGLSVRTNFYSTKHRCRIYTLDLPNGKVSWTYEPEVRHFMMDIQTLGCSAAWGIEQESNALHTLGELVRHSQFKQYLLTGMFIESSKRSGISYVFRRLRPTVALNTKGKSVTIMCALCMHPIAYYAETWAGAMCPTDDVIAHLMLMRGDEPMFWRRCNQHPASSPAAGL